MRNKTDKEIQQNLSDIQMFFHCKKCLDDKPKDASPRDWSRIECGWTKAGFQVWCIRHEKNIIHIDFKGQKVSTK